MESIKNSIREFLFNKCATGVKKGEISNETELIKSGVLDSLNLINLISFLSGKYGIEFDDDDFDTELYRTIESIAQIVERKIN